MTFTRGAGLQVCLFAAVMACFLTGCGGAHTRYLSHLDRGKQYLADGNLDKASIEFRNALQIQPKDAVALYLNGKVAEARSNIREAYSYYQASLDADSKYDPARAGAGKMLIFAHAAKRALDIVEPGLEAHPDNADLLAVRAAAHQQLKDNEAARADAERAVQLQPTNENALAILAALYADAKDYQRGIALVAAALSRSPNSAELREVLTNLYLLSGQSALADEQMRKIVELKPQELAPRSQLALHLIRNHDLDAAQRVLEEAVRALSKSKSQANADQAKLMLVDFISRERSRAQGEKTLRDFIAKEPDNFDLQLGLGILLQRTGTAADALTVYHQIVTRAGTGPKGLMARNRMAAIYVAQRQFAPARKLVAEVLQKNPRDDDALILRATLAMQDNNPGDAIADLRAVLRDQPNSAALQRSLATAYLAKDQPALAEEALRAALKSAPKEPSVRLELAQLLARTDRMPQSVALLEETVKLLPDNLPAREGLIRGYLAAGNVPAAKAAAEELKVRQPQSAAGFYYAGLVAVREKRLADAETSFASALKSQPGRRDVLDSLVRVQVARGSYDAAIGTVRTALEQDSNNVELLNLLGELYLDRKDLKQAGDLFARASAQDPRQWQPLRNLARVKLASNDVEGAAGQYRVALKVAPTEAQLVADAAGFYEKQGRIDEAIAGYEALYKGNPRAQQFAANNLAMLLVTYKSDQLSLDRALDLTSSFSTSDNGTLLDTVGWVRFKRGEFRDALPTLERAAERSPESKVIRFHLAMTQLQLGLRDRARTNLESVLSGSSSFQGVDEARTALASLKVRA